MRQDPPGSSAMSRPFAPLRGRSTPASSSGGDTFAPRENPNTRAPTSPGKAINVHAKVLCGIPAALEPFMHDDGAMDLERVGPMRLSSEISAVVWGLALAALLTGCASSGSKSSQAPPETPEISAPASTRTDEQGGGSHRESSGEGSGAGQAGASGEGEGVAQGSAGTEGATRSESGGAENPAGAESAGSGAGADSPSGDRGADQAGTTPGSGSGTPPPPGGSATADEAASVLDGELDAASREFDRKMREELQRLAAEAATRESGGGSPGGGGATTGTGTGRDGSAGEPTSGEGSSPAGQEGDQTSGEVGGSGPGGEGPSEVPDDVGDGSDDDIVARQLREAAMAEMDPALREKLWDEYRRYKASVSGSNRERE